MSGIINVFFDVSMSNGHNGLKKMLRGKGHGGFSVFINRQWMAMKLITPDQQTVMHYKSPSRKQPINPDTIKHLPYCVGGGKLDYAKALDAAVRKRLEKLGYGG